ncbi:MAG TPA: SDR family oxidoreductase [Gemmatimonadales bacterium]|nr:SDR family oxidoreductase [Gemmatimonadales bacterium]
MELAGRVALVTGAGHRLGRAIALALAGRGMDVAVHYHRSRREADVSLHAIRELGSRAELFQADLSDAAAARALPLAVAEAFGRLDVLVNSAGIMVRATVEETTPELWDQVMDTNLRSMFFTTQGALPALRAAAGRGINLADVGGLEPWPRYAAHCVSKAGVVMLTRTLARALAPDVTVNAVAPGAVLPPDDWDAAAREHMARTTPLGRLGGPQDVTAAVLYLLEGGDYVTGETIVVDGGRLIR